MSSLYREYPPPAHLRAWVQCLWTLDSPAAAIGTHRWPAPAPFPLTLRDRMQKEDLPCC